jgi:coenzyme F420-0:L-glutamate ligase/coenzyme F420-1:gamma-L-glutamate ligase
VPLTRMLDYLIDGSKPQNNPRSVELIPVAGLPRIEPGDNLACMIIDIIKKNGQEIKRDDILVIAHTVVSIAEGRLVQSEEIIVSSKAEKMAVVNERKPQKIQAAINEAVEIIREEPVLITKTKHGLITDMSGVDESNAPPGYYVLLPEDPDYSANQISMALSENFDFKVPIIIADTQGRPWRKGAVNLAIGIAGMQAFSENAGKKDLYGRELRSSLVCIADELAAASELVMGQADEGIPVVIIRGLSVKDEKGTGKQIIRLADEDLFSNL